MLTNGLLVTLVADEFLANEARRMISGRGEALLGRPEGRFLPLAVEVAGPRAAHEFHEWLESLEGVGRVDVICVGLEEPSTPVTTP